MSSHIWKETEVVFLWDIRSPCWKCEVCGFTIKGGNVRVRKEALSSLAEDRQIPSCEEYIVEKVMGE
jgi:hypothetical protein